MLSVCKEFNSLHAHETQMFMNIDFKSFKFICQPAFDTVLGWDTWGKSTAMCVVSGLLQLCFAKHKSAVFLFPVFPGEIPPICCKERMFTCLNTFGERRFYELTKTGNEFLFYLWCLIWNNILDIQLK